MGRNRRSPMNWMMLGWLLLALHARG